MSFNIGSVVECIDDSPHNPMGFMFLSKGMIYTIESKHVTGQVGVHGIPNVHWLESRFRILPDSRLDIFRAMLSPIKTKVKEDA